MSVAIHELEASHPQYEVSVDTAEEILLLCAGLNRVIAEQRLSQEPDETVLHDAESFREQVGEDVVKILSGEMAKGLYGLDNDTILDKVLPELHQADLQPEVKTQQTSIQVVAQQRPAMTFRHPIVHQRITSFYDSRLDDRPHRRFRR